MTVKRKTLLITAFVSALAVSVVGWYDPSQTERVNDIDFKRYIDSDVSFSGPRVREEAEASSDHGCTELALCHLRP